MNNSLFFPKVIASALLIAAASCAPKGNQENNGVVTQTDSIEYDAVLPDSEFQNAAMIRGDFNGDGVSERANVQTIREGGQSKSWIYSIEFGDSGLPPFSFEAEMEGYELVNEGNINDFAGDEISVRTTGNRMNRAYLQTYTFYNGIWGSAMEKVDFQNVVYQQNLPEGLDSLSAQQLVFKENNEVYYYKYVEPEDPVNGGDAFYQKTKAKLYTTINPIEHIYNEDKDIKGDFDGNGSYEMASLKILEEAAGSDETGGRTIMSCLVEFSDRSIKPLKFSSVGEGNDFVSEGNLNKIPGEEISISGGVNSNSYNSLTTYSYKFGDWHEVMNTVMPRAMSADLDIHLDDVIFMENGQVYYYEAESIAEYDNTRNKSSLKKIKADIVWDF